MKRLQSHPILPIPELKEIPFSFEGTQYTAQQGEVISSALFAHGIKIFGKHARDHAPRGIFCANGQCSECMVIADGLAVKACMTEVIADMELSRCKGKPGLPSEDAEPGMQDIRTVQTPFLIIGGGPAGISAAVELAKCGISGILVDDKQALGGKLTLQTHHFFGSRGDCYAGTRGTDIAVILEQELEHYGNGLVDIWLNSSAAGVFNDKKVGIVRQGEYILVEPELLLVATGAREKALAFPGCDLPGVYGAGAFQTLVNRDLIKPCENLFICGGGNVGLIGAYHALQASIEVAGLVEALPECGGYKVHLDKIKRLGVPVYTSHTILRAQGKESLESVTICRIDEQFRPVKGTEKTFNVDTLLIAVGLSPVDELYIKAQEYSINVLSAGDAEEIAEASAAMMSGRIRGREMARFLGKDCLIPSEWQQITDTLRDKPGEKMDINIRTVPGDVYPVIRCVQEIPCDPCIESCPKRGISAVHGALTGRPSFDAEFCLGCAQCVLVCPGLAVTLVDERYDPEKKNALVTMPFEFEKDTVNAGDKIITVDMDGQAVGTGSVIAVRNTPAQDRRRLILVEVPFDDRLHTAGIRIMGKVHEASAGETEQDEDIIICRCERITKKEIMQLIRAGYRDMNHIKAALRTGMGACGGKMCTELILRLFREHGVDLKDVTLPIGRPPLSEIPLSIFAGTKENE